MLGKPQKSRKLKSSTPDEKSNSFKIRRNKIVIASGLILSAAIASTQIYAAPKLPATTATYQTDASLDAALKGYDSLSFEEKKKRISQFRSAHHTMDRAREKSAYILARLNQKGASTDELKQAVALFDEAANYDLLSEKSNWHYVDCARTMGNEAILQDKLSTMLKHTKDAEQKAHIEYNLAQSDLRQNNTEPALEKFKHIIKEAPLSQFAIGSRYYLGQAAADSGDKKEALKYWREYLSKAQDGRFAVDVVKSINKNYADDVEAADHKVFAKVFYLHGLLSDAIGEWRIVGTDEEWYKQGVSLIKTNKRSDGEAILRTGMRKYNTDKNIPDAAKLMARIGTRAEAIDIWKFVLENCPEYGDYALFNLGSRASEDEALAYYEELIQKYPNSEFAPETTWWIAWNKIKTGQLNDALKELKEDAAKFASARSGARYSYWIGKVEEKLNHKEQAKIAYQNTVTKFGHNYYGYRAKARLQELSGGTDSGWATNCSKHLNEYSHILKNGAWVHPEPSSVVSYNSLASTSPLLACMTELHQWDEGLELLPRDQFHELRSIFFAKQGQMMESINVLAKDLHGAPNAQVKWKLSYPLLHANTIKAEASAKQVDPFLAQGLIREESRYNVQAVSSSNALGLMQLLPGTAMGVAKRLGVPIKSKDDIHKPENNLKFGIDYISYVMSRHKGNAMLAVASYNGGPNAVAGWTKKYSMEDPDIFVENIPFNETRDYVRKVFGSYWNYVNIYSTLN